jgi:ribonuclease BN (tRNA processing enzyme)
MRLTVLGTQSPIADETHNCPGFMVEAGDATILLDCGSGTHRMVEMPRRLENLHIFITHLHTDHFNDVFNYQLAAYVYKNLGKLDAPINVYLPETPVVDREYITNQQYQFSTCRYISEGSRFVINSAELTFRLTSHPVETYAVRIRCGGKAVVYTSDTSFEAYGGLAEFAKGADLLVAESSLLTEYDSPAAATHLTAAQAAVIARDAEVGRLVLTHFWHGEDVNKYVEEARRVFPNTVPALEGDVYTW